MPGNLRLMTSQFHSLSTKKEEENLYSEDDGKRVHNLFSERKIKKKVESL